MARSKTGRSNLWVMVIAVVLCQVVLLTDGQQLISTAMKSSTEKPKRTVVLEASAGMTLQMRKTALEIVEKSVNNPGNDLVLDIGDELEKRLGGQWNVLSYDVTLSQTMTRHAKQYALFIVDDEHNILIYSYQSAPKKLTTQQASPSSPARRRKF